MPDPDRLDAALTTLQRQLADVRLPLVAREAHEAQAAAAAAAGQIGDYVLPRLRSLDAPLLVVVAGSTGSGKSTVVNSLVGRTVTRPGVLRPTTRHPVLVHHPEDVGWFADDRILPGLPRITTVDPGAGPPGAEDVLGLHLVADAAVPAGLALLDAPDIDSVARANRELAAMLMAAADLWIFLTTAARYADAVPWAALRAAVARDTAIALVLNRVPGQAVPEVTGHLRTLLATEGLADAPLFVVVEGPLRDGFLAAEAIGPIRGWIDVLGGDAAARAAVARRTLDGAIANLAVQVLPVADAADRQVLAATRLRELATGRFDAAERRVAEVTADGSMLRGEVLARWQEFVGASEVFRSLESGMARVRDRVGRALRGEPAAPQQAAEALESGLARVLLDELATAREEADAAWRDDPAGVALLAALDVDLAALPEDARAQAEALVRDWQGDVLAMVRSEGADRRTSARVLAYGVNGTAVALMVLVFSATGGITGAEVGIAGGSAVLAQKLLEAVFSEDAVRRMAQDARDRLAERVAALFAEHGRGFTDRVDALGVDPGIGRALRLSVAEIVGAREPVGDAPGLPAAPPGAVPGSGGSGARMRGRLRAWFGGAS